MKDIKHVLFWPIILIMFAICSYSLINTHHFIEVTTQMNQWILHHFGGLISISTLTFLFICIAVYISPLGKLKIGGEKAEKLLSPWRWFSITLCTTIATGILFWGTAEPLFHLHQPPQGLGLSANSPESSQFALSTMFLHWSVIPYGIYTLAALMFALSYYNMHQPFSLGSMLYPLFGKRVHGFLGTFVDAISLLSLVAGMAASLGAGIIILAGGLEKIAGISYSVLTLGAVAVLIVSTFILSAISGLMRGIRFLSDINIKVFIGLGVFVFIFGPSLALFRSGISAFGEFIVHFFDRSTIGVFYGDEPWAHNWTIFYWANWLAWTPITAIFLGRIGRGYSVRQFIHINLLFPSIFAFLWMTIFSGTALHQDMSEAGSPLFTVLSSEGGVSKVIFEILDRLPLRYFSSGIFLLAAFLSYVTAADSNTSAMSGISSSGISPSSPEPTLWIKVSWGVLIGTIAWVMIAFSGEGMNKGIDGIRILSNLGGFPALFLVILVALGMIRLLLKPKLLKPPENDQHN